MPNLLRPARDFAFHFWDCLDVGGRLWPANQGRGIMPSVVLPFMSNINSQPRKISEMIARGTKVKRGIVSLLVFFRTCGKYGGSFCENQINSGIGRADLGGWSQSALRSPWSSTKVRRASDEVQFPVKSRCRSPHH